MATIFDDFRVGDTVTVFSATAPDNNGTYAITSIDTGLLGTSPPPPVPDLYAPDTVFTVTRNYSGNYTVSGVADGFIETNGVFPQTVTNATANIQKDELTPVTEWTDWVVLPSTSRTEVWANIVALQGMYRDDGGRTTASVDFQIQIERLNASTLAPTGQVEDVFGTISGAVSDERAETIERVTAWVGPARVRARRTTQYDYDFEGTIVDEIKFADLYAVSPVSKPNFGNLTTIHTVTRATTRATIVKNRELNCLASRLIPTYNGSAFSATMNPDGTVASGTLNASSRIFDVLCAVALDPKIGGRAVAELDLAQMWGVQMQLEAWNPACAQVNYTFDSDEMSFEETARIIANAGFCQAYRQSGRIRLAPDLPQSASVALFTHRNKQPKGETVTRSFASDSEYDGVSFAYSDPDTESTETIELPLDGSAINPKKFEIPGIRSFTQAWLRAQREYRKLLYQRVVVETTCTTDARALLPNSRVDIVDNTRFRSYDGEVLAQEGMVLRLSQRVAFAAGQPHSIVLMRRDGTLQGIACTEVAGDPYRVVLAALPSEPVVTEGGADGVRTIYSFASDSARAKLAYSVQKIGAPQNGYVTISAVNYAPEVYAADYQPIPDKGSIINS